MIFRFFITYIFCFLVFSYFFSFPPSKSRTDASKIAHICLSVSLLALAPSQAHNSLTWANFGALCILFSKGELNVAIFVCASIFLLTASSLKELQKRSVFIFQRFAYCLYYFKYQIPFRFIQVRYQFCKFYTVIAWFCYLVSYKQVI